MGLSLSFPPLFRKVGRRKGKSGEKERDGWMGPTKKGKGGDCDPNVGPRKEKKVRAGFGCWPGVRERGAGQIFDHGSRRAAAGNHALPFSQTSSPPPPLPFTFLN